MKQSNLPVKSTISLHWLLNTDCPLNCSKQLFQVLLTSDIKVRIHLFYYKQFIFYLHPENCLSLSKKSPQKLFSNVLVDGLLN